MTIKLWMAKELAKIKPMKTFPPATLDEKGRCCGRKPIVYKRQKKLFCCRCLRDYGIETKEQIPSFAWVMTKNFQFHPAWCGAKHPAGTRECHRAWGHAGLHCSCADEFKKPGNHKEWE